MKKKIIFFMTFFLVITLGFNANAQTCPANNGTITGSITTTPRTCGSNGKISVTVNNTTDIALVLLKGGVVLQQVIPTSSPYEFSNLNFGNDYQVRIICKYDNSVTYQTISATVADNYVQITNATITSSDVCTNFTQGGTINVSNVVGGTAPYQVSIIQNSNISYDDSLSSYVTTNLNTTTYSKAVNAFGTYQVRIKDACGNYKTFTTSLAATYPPVQFSWVTKKVCNSNLVQGRLWYLTNTTTNGTIDFSIFQSTGLRIKIQDTNATGAILYEGLYTSGGTFTYVPNATHTYYVTVTNPCGITESYVKTYNEVDNHPEFFTFTPISSTSGCGTTGNPVLESIKINFSEQTFWNYPVTITLRNSANTVINLSTYGASSTSDGSNWSVNGLPVDTYTITVADSCNPANTLTKTVSNPTAAGPPTLSIYQTVRWRCTGIGALTQTGTVQALVKIDGYLSDRANAVVKITSGPSNVGVNGVLVEGTYWGWSNMLPGTYNVSYSTCGNTYTGSFTVGTNSVLQQSLTSTATSFCQGGGNVTSNLVYNGAYPFTVELLNSAGTVIANNSTGNFTGLASGTYTTRLKINACSNNPTYYVTGSTVTIATAASNPGINPGFTGVVCEDSSGNPLSTGSAYFDFIGVAPFKLSYKPTSSSTWTVQSNLPSSYSVSGLLANTLYDILLEDSCGGSYTVQQYIGTMQSLTTETTAQPCNGSPYQLVMHYYSGATYEWVNPQGVVVSNTRTYNIANYNSTYNGLYTVKIQWSNCVTRYVTVYVNSAFCGGNLGCFKDAGTNAPILESKHGITSLGRAGANNGNWPMVRKGAHTVLESKTKGFVINRLETAQKNLLAPVEGMMVYDTDLDCLSIYSGGAWKCFSNPGCPDF